MQGAGCRVPCYGLQDAGRFATGGRTPCYGAQDALLRDAGCRMQDAGCRMPCNGGGATDTSPGARDAQNPKR
jgi:hypothetical protein